MKIKKKSLDNEINLISFISLLSVLICTLLLSTVWVKVATLDINQAVGGAKIKSSDKNKKNPRLWVKMNKYSIQLKVKNFKKLQRKLRLKNFSIKNGKWSEAALTEHVKKIIKKLPKLKQAFVKPNSISVYEDVIKLMDSLKVAGVSQLGIVPL
ncbi:MAG: hypothetical protein HAW60_04220 [Bdellovibrionales bacterium]|nr:hypothetical protein [Bdellovibrionales bacterium]